MCVFCFCVFWLSRSPVFVLCLFVCLFFFVCREERDCLCLVYYYTSHIQHTDDFKTSHLAFLSVLISVLVTELW